MGLVCASLSSSGKNMSQMSLYMVADRSNPGKVSLNHGSSELPSTFQDSRAIPGSSHGHRARCFRRLLLRMWPNGIAD